MDENLRQILVDWEVHARLVLAQFRVNYSRLPESDTALQLQRLLGMHSQLSQIRSIARSEPANNPNVPKQSQAIGELPRESVSDD
jgi:hypothetical protein